MNQQTTIIRRPQDEQKLELLRQKLREYTSRLENAQKANPYKAPELFAAYYAKYILNKLLSDGYVDTWELSREMGINTRNGLLFFERYCGVIKDYAETGGMNTYQANSGTLENSNVE